MSKRSNWTQVFIFLGFIALFFILNLLLPDRDFSERENRYLQQRPKFSFSSLASGEFTSDFESYTTDQFTLRDSWTTLKARSEIAIGKAENNGVYLCEGDTLIERFQKPPYENLDGNLAALEKLTQNVKAEVYFALIPGAAEIWSGKLPTNAPNDSQKDVIDYAYGKTAVKTLDMYGVLSAHADEYIFYRTDHHWTSLGAYYGYTALCGAFGFDAPELTAYTRKTVSDRFYGTIYSSSGISWVEPDSIETFVEAGDTVTITNFPKGTPVQGMLYDETFLARKDKYSMFLGGNTPLLQIDTGVENAPSLLVVRDSYMDSLTPFILQNFSSIHIIDLRYYRESLAGYIEENGIGNVLVCYSVNNFCTDKNLFLLGM